MEIDDNYDHDDESLVYIVESVLYVPEPNKSNDLKEYTKLKDLYNSVLNNPCSCSGKCNAKTADCHHGASYVKTRETNELVLNPSRISSDLIYECFQFCKCPSNCSNRLVQFGPRKHLKLFQTERKGRGLATERLIPKGGFICEYGGEILTRAEAERRTQNVCLEDKMNYIICLNEIPQWRSNVSGSSEALQTFIDPSVKGNIGRYLNHSCDPNCLIFSVRIDCPVPKLGIFAKRKIVPNEELCFDYGSGGKSLGPKQCFCGSEKCRGKLPNLSF